MTNALAGDMRQAMSLLIHGDEHDNIQKRPDICTLRTAINEPILGSSFSAHGGSGVFIWALRDQGYVNAWMAALSNGGTVEDCKRAVRDAPKAQYVRGESWPPTFLNCVLNRDKILDWKPQVVARVGRALDLAVASGKLHDYNNALKRACDLPSLKAYGAAHLVRTALVTATPPKCIPSQEFIGMGSGANYNFFLNRGMTNVHMVNATMKKYTCDQQLVLDTGNLAYLLCRLKSNKVDGWELLHEGMWSEEEKQHWRGNLPPIHYPLSLLVVIALAGRCDDRWDQ